MTMSPYHHQVLTHATTWARATRSALVSAVVDARSAGATDDEIGQVLGDLVNILPDNTRCPRVSV